MSILAKTLYRASGDFGFYQINLDNGVVREIGIIQSGLVGSYTIDPLFNNATTRIDTGKYLSALIFSPDLYKNTAVSLNLSVSFADVSVSGWVVGSTPENGEIRVEDPNVDVIVKPFAQLQNDYNLDIYYNSDFNSGGELSDISNYSNYTYDLSDSVTGLNSENSWLTQTNLAIVFNPSGDNGIRYISFDQVQILYNSIEPSTPSNIIGSGGNALVYLSWQPPLNDGGDDIIDYSVQYANILDGFTEWTSTNTKSSDTFFTINNLVNDNPYIFRVAAINAVGTGNYSDPSISIYPEEPKIVTAANFNDSNYARIRLRRDTAANWSGVNPVLALGEAGYETDTRLLKVGDNNTEWSDLGYVKVENSSIDFPSPPDVLLRVGSSDVLGEDSPEINCNLSDDTILNLVGGDGISLKYSNTRKSVVFSIDNTFSAFTNDTVVSPSGYGIAGQIYYDSDYIYMCVGPNSWQRIEVTPENWFGFEQTSISNNEGNYPSITTISSSGTQINIVSDGDPYPAKASSNLANDGSTARALFFESFSIQDQEYDFSFRYRGGTATSVPHYAISGINGICTNGALFSSPDTIDDQIGSTAPPDGFHYNRTFFSSYLKVDNCGGYANYYNKYIYCNGKFLLNCWNDTKVYNSNTYYGGTNYLGDYYRHTDGHSKIIGYCFDGYPVYGPFGYTDAEIPSNGVSLMTSSYVLKQDDSHRPTNWEYNRGLSVDGNDYVLSAGAFIEDYEYSENEGILDQYNGRYAVTPEYPNGTYAYYLTFTDSTMVVPKYPYIIGNYSKQHRQI